MGFMGWRRLYRLPLRPDLFLRGTGSVERMVSFSLRSADHLRVHLRYPRTIGGHRVDVGARVHNSRRRGPPFL
jgi:hypothetical protein